MKTPDYLSYDRYKKKKSANPNKRILISVTTFFVALLFFSVVAKSLSPDVDVTIGDESQTEAKDTGLGVKRFIDERLKMIQMEDNSAGVSLKEAKNNKNIEEESESYDKYMKETDEKINLPSKRNRASQADSEGTEEEPVIPARVAPPRPSGRDLSTPFESQAPAKMSKVYVGRYATVEQAKVAQEILLDSGINVTPFVKNIGGAYTLQVGSYSSRAKADGLASELQRNNFPARIVQE